MAHHTPYSEEVLSFCQRLPKVELHAHLNGELAAEHSLDPALMRLIDKGERTLAECFKLFDVIHKVTTDHATISRIAREVAEDFAADNVIYLELRTTPKDRPECGMTKESYTLAVLAGLKSFGAQGALAGRPRLEVRLLLSIDRREDAGAAAATVELAGRLRGAGVVGVDLSGNPCVGEWAAWRPALLRAQELGLRRTLHAGEVPNPHEMAAMLALRPERLGHMCCMGDAAEAALHAARIPVELCLTSNVVTRSVACVADHHFRSLYAAGHPVVLCTDDSGVFMTTLSREYAIAAHAFGFTRRDLVALARQAIDYAFVDERERGWLIDSFQTLTENLQT